MMWMSLRSMHIVRTNIAIDDKLMQATLKATGIKTKREDVWEGGLDAARRVK